MRLHVLFPLLLTVGLLTPQGVAAFPTDGQWIAVVLRGEPLSDINGDAANPRSDLVGNAENPAGYFYQDASGLYLRMRLDATPEVGGGSYHPASAWGVALEYDGDPNSFDAIVWLDGNKPATVHLRANVDSEGLGACDVAETLIASGPGADWARVVPAGSNFAGSPDVFLDFFIPTVALADLPPGPQGQLPLPGTKTQFIFGTSNSAGGFAFEDDIAGSDVSPIECTIASYLDLVSDVPQGEWVDDTFQGDDPDSTKDDGDDAANLPPEERRVVVSDTEEEALETARDSKVDCLWVRDPNHKGAGVAYMCEPSTLGGGAMGCAAGGSAGVGQAVILLMIIGLYVGIRRGRVTLLLLAGLLLMPESLWAMDTERYRISPSPTGWTAVDQYDVVEPGDLSAGFFLQFAKDPVVYRHQGRITRRVVSGRLASDLVGAFGVYKRVEIGLAVPAVLYQTGEGFFPDKMAVPPAFSLGDVRVRPKIALLTPTETGADWGLSIVPGVHLPTSRNGALAGSDGVSFHPELIGGGRVGPWAFAGNVGAAFRRETREWGVTESHTLFYRAAAAWLLPTKWARDWGLAATGELLGQTAAKRPFSHSGANPLEFMAGAMGDIRPGLSWHGGVGTGLLPGIGSPTFRMMAGVRWSLPNDAAGVGAPGRKGPAGSAGPEVHTGPFSGAQRAAREIAERNRKRTLAMIKGDRIELGRTVTFLTGQEILTPESFELLDAVANVLRAEKNLKVRIVGHTDNVGGPELNQPLSLRRAEAVAKYLVGKGIHSKRLKVEGRGQTQPIADNATSEGRDKNRRVEFLVEK